MVEWTTGMDYWNGPYLYTNGLEYLMHGKRCGPKTKCFVARAMLMTPVERSDVLESSSVARGNDMGRK